MEKWFILALSACVAVLEPCLAGNVAADDGEYEKVVVWQKKKRQTGLTASDAAVAVPAVPVVPAVVPGAVIVPAVVTVPQVTPSVPVAPAVEAKPEEPPPPPEPPEADAAEPRRLVRYFCKAWKDQDYERMWWAMSPRYRKKTSLKKFKKLFESDAEQNGGLKDENILEEGETRKGGKSVKTELIFKFPRAKHRIVSAQAERQAGGAFRLVESALIPLDFDDL